MEDHWNGSLRNWSARKLGPSSFPIIRPSVEQTFVTTSQLKHFLSELEELEARIPEGKLEYLRERTRNNLYSFIIRKFLEQKKEAGLTNAKLAHRLGYDPGRLSRLLGAPGNWTISTVSDLLAGIAGEELSAGSKSLLDQAPRNDRGQYWSKREGSSIAHASFDIASDGGQTTVSTGQRSGISGRAEIVQ